MKTRISAPAHLSATGGRESGLFLGLQLISLIISWPVVRISLQTAFSENLVELVKHRFLVLSRALALRLVRSCSLSCPLISLFLLSDSLSLASSRFLPLSMYVSFTLALQSLWITPCVCSSFALDLALPLFMFVLSLFLCSQSQFLCSRFCCHSWSSSCSNPCSCSCYTLILAFLLLMLSLSTI